MAQHFCFFHCVGENPFASLGKGNIDGWGYFGFGGYASFHFGTNVFVRFRWKEARDDIGIFPQYAEKQVLCIHDHAAVLSYEFASVKDGSPCSLGKAFKHGYLELYGGVGMVGGLATDFK